MNLISYLIAPLLSLAVMVAVIWALRTKRLRERHAFWWVSGSVVALLVSLFPATLQTLSGLIGIEVPLNLALIFGIALIFLVSLQHSSELTSLEEKVRTLAEHVAEIEMILSSKESENNSLDS